ncbi:Glycerol-3-phosphate dehydrogenase [Heterostelium album PN500]|uniref:Glycerol-3-phosphate dehydrogenase n=1 Tax=Heterostelium pallidum (strain ATCC 26659 / Pp 5 / PN500) TaxID=670386 RepID=D3B8W3_HETP5|nr:Glycerol-3-phosphate dehydrogenase [Heterostelium album PN500]EFA82481.1 Glycerol-3-phosphate dehydrogenase [Heterostelium album PN500]|eukprot:XP_020434598.1 Glycerol-3-phosphate dehydrogenase [Heterostelium album PN500]
MSKLFSFIKRNKLPLAIGTGAVWFAHANNMFSPYPRESYSDRHDRINRSAYFEMEPDKLLTAPFPSRQQQLAKLEEYATKPIDVIVIGGGATGSGVALDSQTRGLSTALFERGDFSSGTSSRSTKLIHGGIRYLESAIMNLDYQDLKLVKEALNERSNLLNNAPHLSHALPLAIPIYSWIDLPKMMIGTKLYDFFYPGNDIPGAYYLSKAKTMEKFPHLKDGCLGSVIYYDGQHNDARMNLSIVMSARANGALTMNYMQVASLLKEQQKVVGVVVEDRLTGKQYNVRAKSVVNATGPFADGIRKMDDPNAAPMVIGASGTHLILPRKYCPDDMGFLNPKTKDGRVLFILPFEGRTIAGTTDQAADVTFTPKPTHEEIQFILETVSEYYKDNLTDKDVLASWTGIRPLIKSSPNTPTSKINRHHTLITSPSGLITISGGKWTTYREMAEETVDKVVEQTRIFTPKESHTVTMKLFGGDKYYKDTDKYLIKHFNIEPEIANHLAHTYGDQAVSVCKLAKERGLFNRLVQGYPYIEAEAVYAVQEYACNAEDVIARRTRLAFLDNQKSREALPRIVDLMATELKWSKSTKENQLKEANKFLDTMNY